MSESPTKEDIEATVKGLRDILFNQTVMIDFYLILLSKRNEPGFELKSGDAEVVRIILTMMHMVRISGHTVLRLTEKNGPQVRDCYPRARHL